MANPNYPELTDLDVIVTQKDKISSIIEQINTTYSTIRALEDLVNEVEHKTKISMTKTPIIESLPNDRAREAYYLQAKLTDPSWTKNSRKLKESQDYLKTQLSILKLEQTYFEYLCNNFKH